MPYNIQLPDGTLVQGIPDDIDPATAKQRIIASRPDLFAAPKPEDDGFFDMTGRAITRGFKQTGSLLGDVLPAMVGKAVGADEYAARQMAEAEETQREIAEKYAPRYGQLSDVKGVGDFLPFAVETAAEQLPNLLTSIIPGAGGAVIGGRVAAGQAAKAIAAREGTKEVAEEAARRYTAQAARTGAGRGGLGGAFLGSYALNAPEIFQNIEEETGQMEVGASLLAASVSAALDSILPAAIVRQFTPGMRAGVVEKILERSGMPPGVARGAASGVITGIATEGPTEAMQEAISITAEKFVQENPELWGSKEFNRLIESGVRGAVGGGAVSGVAGGVRGYMDRPRPELLEDTSLPDEETKETEVITPGTPPGAPPGTAGATAVIDPLAGFDLNTVDPTKVQEAQQFLQDFNAGTLKDDTGQLLGGFDKAKELQNIVRSLGIPLKKGQSRKIVDLLPLLTTALTPKGAVDVTGSQQGTTGAGVGVSGGPGQTDTTGGAKPSEDAGVGVPDRVTGETGVGESTVSSPLAGTSTDEILRKIQELEARKNKTLKIGDDGDIDAQLAALKAELERRGVQLPTAPTELTFQTEQDLDRKEVSAEFAAQKQELQNTYETSRQVMAKVREEEGEGKRRALPAWGELSADEKMVFEDSLGTYGQVLEEGQSIQDVIDDALEDLFTYRQAKGDQKGQKNTAIGAYEINRRAEARVRDVDFPPWAALSSQAKQAYLDKVYSPNERTREYPGPDYETQQSGFDAVQETLGPEASLKTRGMREAVSEAEREEAARKAARNRKEDEELSLGAKLPPEIVEAVKAGDVTTVLNYLKDNAKGVPGLENNDMSRAVNRLVAEPLAILLGGDKYNLPAVKLVYYDNLSTAAEYNPKTNTILVGPRGLNEVAILHEAVHAATVRVIYIYLKGDKNLLTKSQREGVEHILRIRNATRKNLSAKYRNAYSNIYEFVAYAMTDPKFQRDLREVKIEPSQRERLVKYTDIPEAEIGTPNNASMWDAMVNAMATVIGLTNRVSRLVKNYLISYKKAFRTRTSAYEPYKPGQRTRDEDEAREFDELMQAYEDETGRTTPKYGKELTVEGLDYDQAIKERNKARLEFKRVSTKYKNQTVEQLNQNEEYQTVKAKFDALDEAIEAAKEDVSELKDKGVSYYSEPGYLGNLFLEVTGAFNNIMSAPPEGGIKNWGNAPLYIKAPTIKRDAQSVENDLLGRLNTNSETILGRVKGAISSIFTKTGYENLVRTVQNKTVAFDKLRELMRMRNQLKVVGGIDEYNDLATAYYSGTALAQNFMNKFVPLTNEATDLMQSLMKSMGLDYNQLLAKLHTYMIGLQEPERRHILFMRPNEEGGVPLTADADTARVKIWQRIRDTMPKDVLAAEQANDQARLAQLKQEADNLRTQLEDIVYDRNIISGTTNRKIPNDPNINNEFDKKYDALGYDYSIVLEFKKAFDAAVQKHPELKRLMDGKDSVLQKVMDQTQQFNKETNYFNAGAQATIWFYGWKSYFPFKGKPADPSGKTKIIEAAIDPYSDRIGGDFAQGENTMMGRQSDADNPVLQIFTEATRSTLRKGYFMAPHALKNLINSKRVAGSGPVTISFKERATPGFILKEKIKQNSFLIYQPDGSIDVYDINDPKILRAFKGTFTPDQPLIDAANKLTSAVGQMHTRYNPAFAPLDFTRNLMTYAGIVGFKYGPRAALQLITAMSRVVAEGGMHKTFKYTMAYQRGDEKALRQLMGKDPDDFYKDIDTYYKLGGPVAYLQGLTNIQSQAEFAKRLQRTKVGGLDVDDFSNFFDSWLAMFETTSRIAAFRTVKQQLKAANPKMTEDELNQRAMAEAKDLANFQKVGEIGKGLGAAFMFWRPAATGAVKAIDALLPAFDTRTEKELFKYYKEQAGAGTTTDDEARAAVKQHMLERRNARYMGYGLIGAGMFTYLMAYMLAGEDEEERNKVAIDDMARWVRFLRINTGIEVNGRDLVVQWAWGFGPGALASAGAQIAALSMGNQSFMAAANNIMDAGFESFVPLPISKIDKFANPSAAAVDSLTPSVLRPFLQYAMNTDGLGRRIYSDRQSRYGDAFLGSDNVPAIFTDIARGIFEMTGGSIDWSPSTLYFFANNYVDGISRATATTYNISQIMVGNKNFDPRTDTFFLDSYLKAPSNYDAIQFSKAENKIKEMAKILSTVKGTPAYAEYVSNNPTHPRIVKFYNDTINGKLRDLRTLANQVRRDPNLTTQERQDKLRLLINQQNRIKSAFTTAVSGLDDDFGSFGYED
jgi:hypothetical protein